VGDETNNPPSGGDDGGSAKKARAPMSPEARAAAAQKQRVSRQARKFKEAKSEAELARLAREYAKAAGEDVPDAEPAGAPEGVAHDVANDTASENAWPAEERIAAKFDSATELWGAAKEQLSGTRYGACLAVRVVEMPGEGGVLVRKAVDPIKDKLARPTAALMAKNNFDLPPGWALVAACAFTFGPTLAKHAGELGGALYLKLQARKQLGEHVETAQEVKQPTQPTQPASVVELKPREAGRA
jgi:hypothetical protein